MWDHQILLALISDGNIVLEDKEIVVCAISMARLQKVELLEQKNTWWQSQGMLQLVPNVPKKLEKNYGNIWRIRRSESETFQGMHQHFLEDYGDSDEERALDEGSANRNWKKREFKTRKHKAVMWQGGYCKGSSIHSSILVPSWLVFQPSQAAKLSQNAYKYGSLWTKFKASFLSSDKSSTSCQWVTAHNFLFERPKGEMEKIWMLNYVWCMDKQKIEIYH